MQNAAIITIHRKELQKIAQKYAEEGMKKLSTFKTEIIDNTEEDNLFFFIEADKNIGIIEMGVLTNDLQTLLKKEVILMDILDMTKEEQQDIQTKVIFL